MIPVYKPWLTSLEKKYINDAVDTSWISSTGKYVDKAEELFAAFVGTKYAIVASSGTTALHLCYRALPNSDDGLVLIPNTTFIATAFTASYDNRRIRFVDVDPVTWNIDVDEVERICKQEQVSIVVPVHLYGNPADMVRLLNLQAKYEFKIIEDACESLGAKIGNKVTGSMSDVACFSFYGNKTFTCLPEHVPVIINRGFGPEVLPISKIPDSPDITVPTKSADGRIEWAKVSRKIIHKSRKKCLRISAAAGRIIECSDDHKLFKYQNSEIVPILASELKPGDYLVAPKTIPTEYTDPYVLDLANLTNYQIKSVGDQYFYESDKPIRGGNRKKLQRYQTLDVDLATILGYYTAEGSYSGDRLTWSFAYNEDCITHLTETWTRRFPGWALSTHPDGSKETVIAGGKLHHAIWNELGALGLAHEKRIPNKIFSSPRHIQLAYLRAYWSGDGCISYKSGKTYIEFKTVSKWLATDIHYLLLLLGFTSTFEISEPARLRQFPTGEYQCRESYRIRSGEIDLVNFLAGTNYTPRGNILEHRVPTNQISPAYGLPQKLMSKKSIGCNKINNWEKNTHFAFLKITEIKEVPYNGLWYDIQVPGTNSFIAGLGAVLVHNCGEGGAITTNDEAIASKAKLLRGQAQDPNKRYWHVDIGYNYRLTNTHAAILCGQLERAQEILAEKYRVSERYLEHLSNVEEIQFQRVLPGHIHSHWLVTFTLPPGKNNQDFSSYMMSHGVDTRKIFYPVTDMPPYANHKTKYSVASYLSRQGVSLPSYPQLTSPEIDKICNLIKSYFT